MDWGVDFHADLAELVELARNCEATPSRFRSFVRHWKLRGTGIHSQPDDLERQISSTVPNVLWVELAEAIRLRTCRIENRVPAGRTARLDTWEDSLGMSSGVLARHGQDVLAFFASFLDGEHGCAILDPYFWSNDLKKYPETIEARAALLDRLAQCQVAAVCVVSTRSRESAEAVQEALRRWPWFEGRLQTRVVRPGRAGHNFHDRFYAVFPRTLAPDAGEYRLCIGLGPGVRAFRPEPCIRTVVAIDPGDFQRAWREIWADAEVP